MILPSKHLAEDRALVTVGARILQHLTRPKTVSALWEEMPRTAVTQKRVPPLGYDRFVLALDLLFFIGAIELEDGLLSRKPL